MVLERTYIVPLRSGWLKSQRYKRAKKAVTTLREFIARHMKQEDYSMIKIGPMANEAIWARGIRNPLHKIKVTVVKEDDGTVKVELFGYKYIDKVKKEKKEEATGIAGKLKEAIGGGKEKKEKEAEAEVVEEKKEKVEKKEMKKEEKKPAEKKEKKAVKK